MPAYLKFYELDRSAFEDESESKVVLGTKALRDALSKIQSGLEEGAARICVNGQAGMGKTSLARALPKLLDDASRIAVILTPSASWNSIRSSIAKQWKTGEGGLARSNLLSLARDTRLVLVVDQAESASTDILDHLDVLLSYRTEDNQPVVQSVLFANLAPQPEKEPAPLLWWLDRIQTLELQFAPLPRDGVGSYIQKHLKRAGWKNDSLFTAEAAHAIHGYTSGIPGEVGRVCEQLLVDAAGQNLREIDAAFVHERLDDRVAEDSNSYDTFEELVMEDAFIGAETSNPAEEPLTPSLKETLEHFARSETNSNGLHDDIDHVNPSDDDFDDSGSHEEEETTDARPNAAAIEVPDELDETVRDEAPILDLMDAPSVPSQDEVDTNAEPTDSDLGLDSEVHDVPTDSALIELEDYLSHPPTEAELHALIGRQWGSFARKAALVALAIMVGGTTIALLGRDDHEADSKNQSHHADKSHHADNGHHADTSVDDAVASPKPTLFAGPNGLSAAIPEKPAIARLRGPVAESAPAAKPAPAAESAPTANTAPAANRAPAANTEPVAVFVPVEQDQHQSIGASDVGPDPSRGSSERHTNPPAALVDPIHNEGPR